jgi:hypothetical protein
VPARVTALSSLMLIASPKSHSLSLMSAVNRMFSGLISLQGRVNAWQQQWEAHHVEAHGHMLDGLLHSTCKGCRLTSSCAPDIAATDCRLVLRLHLRPPVALCTAKTAPHLCAMPAECR